MAKADKQSVLQERVAARLAELRRSPRDVSLKAGLGPDAIRTILSGRSRSPRVDTLSALADELQCDVAYLLGQSDKPYESEALRRNKDGIVRGVAKLPIGARLSNSWKKLDGHEPSDDPFHFGNERIAISNVYSLPQYLTGPQSLEFVEDDHASPTIPKGSYLHVLSLTGPRFDIKDGDLVVVSRQSLAADGSGLIQRSCRIFRRLSPREVLLDLPNTSLREPPIRLVGRMLPAADGGFGMEGGQTVLIDALVLRCVIEFAGAPVYEGQVNPWNPESVPVQT